jgi:riboflavin biosynthesis pyrimidine reductase
MKPGSDAIQPKPNGSSKKRPVIGGASSTVPKRAKDDTRLLPSNAPLTPLDVLFEADGLPSVELPPELRRLHGGDLGFREPCVVANFVSTLDGVVAIPSIERSNDVIAAGSRADHFIIGLLRAFADVVLVGSGTLRASPQGTWRPEKVFPPAAEAFAELRRALGRAASPRVAILSGRGTIDPAHPILATGALVLTSEIGASQLDGALPEASELVTLGTEAELDPLVAIDALHRRGHLLVLSEAGPHTFGGLLSAGAVDELFLTVSPLLAGDAGPGSRLRLVEAADLLPPLRGRPLSARRHDDHLFLRYGLERRAG